MTKKQKMTLLDEKDWVGWLFIESKVSYLQSLGSSGFIDCCSVKTKKKCGYCAGVNNSVLIW